MWKFSRLISAPDFTSLHTRVTVMSNPAAPDCGMQSSPAGLSCTDGWVTLRLSPLTDSMS